MFATRYFPDRYFAAHYWPKIGAAAASPTDFAPLRRAREMHRVRVLERHRVRVREAGAA